MWTGPERRNMLCELKYIERKITGKGYCLSRGLGENWRTSWLPGDVPCVDGGGGEVSGVVGHRWSRGLGDVYKRQLHIWPLYAKVLTQNSKILTIMMFFIFLADLLIDKNPFLYFFSQYISTRITCFGTLALFTCCCILSSFWTSHYLHLMKPWLWKWL